MTKSMIAALAAALACAAAPTTQAAQMQGMKMESAPPKTGSAIGVVKAIDAKAGTITIEHGPIPSVGWPAMTMAFKASTPAVLHAANVGTRVAFAVRVQGTNAEVTSIKPK